MKRTLKLITLLLAIMLLATTLVACVNSKPTKTFTDFSKYISEHSVSTSSDRIEYRSLNDDYFGKINLLTVSSYKNMINFTFYVSGGYLSVNIYDYEEAKIEVTYHENEGDVYVELEYSSLQSSTVWKSAEVEVNGVKMEKTSNIYPVAVKNAEKAVKYATSWMSSVIVVTLDNKNLNVHDLYNK